MSANSLNSSFSMGTQSIKGTAASAFKTALATSSEANAKFDERTPKLEHPSPVSRATKVKTAPQRTGYVMAVGANFLLHPRFLGMALKGAGFGCVTTSGTNHKIHTFTLAARDVLPWMSVIKTDGDPGNVLSRLITDVRLSKLSINATLEEIECEITGTGLLSGPASGSETYQAESSIEISPYSGSATITINGVAYTAPLRGNTFDIEQALKEDDKVLFSSVRADLPQSSIGVTGKLQNVDIDYNAFQAYTAIVNNAGSAPSLVAATGAISWLYNSPSNIPTASVPYSLAVTIPSVYYKLADFKATDDSLIRCDVEYGMIDDTSTPITIVLKNDVTSY